MSYLGQVKSFSRCLPVVFIPSSSNFYLSSWVTDSPNLLAGTELLLCCPCSQCLSSWPPLSDLLSRVEGPVFSGSLGLPAPVRLPVVSAMLGAPVPAELFGPFSQEPSNTRPLLTYSPLPSPYPDPLLELLFPFSVRGSCSRVISYIFSALSCNKTWPSDPQALFLGRENT